MLWKTDLNGLIALEGIKKKQSLLHRAFKNELM